ECDKSFPPHLTEALLRDSPDELLADAEPLQIKDRCTAARLDDVAGPFLIKRHIWGNWRRSARMMLRVPTSRVSAATGLRLASVDFPTPHPRASLEFGFGPFGIRSYLITDFVEGTPLNRLIRSGTAQTGLLHSMARQVATAWQQLIDLRISHNDLKPENF